MKNFIHAVPEKWLKEKQRRKLKEIIVLKDEHYIWRTEIYHRSAREDKFLRLVFEKTSNDNECTREDKETDGDHPKNRRKDLKGQKPKKCRQHGNHTRKKYRISIVCIIDPEPETENHEQWKWYNHTVVHVPPEKTPK